MICFTYVATQEQRLLFVKILFKRVDFFFAKLHFFAFPVLRVLFFEEAKLKQLKILQQSKYKDVVVYSILFTDRKDRLDCDISEHDNHFIFPLAAYFFLQSNKRARAKSENWEEEKISGAEWHCRLNSNDANLPQASKYHNSWYAFMVTDQKLFLFASRSLR